MKISHGRCFLLIISVALSACGSEQSRVELINSDSRIAEADANAIDESGASLLAVQVASVSAPLVEQTGLSAQATSFDFHEDYAFVSYNTAGESLGGGIEVFDLKQSKEPKLVASLLSKNIDLSDLKAKDEILVAVGADVHGGLLEIYDISKSKKPVLESSLSFDGYVATSVALEDQYAYVTIGDNQGMAVVNLEKPSEPSIEYVYGLENALFVLRSEHHSYLLGGSSDLQIYDAANKSLSGFYTVSESREEAPVRAAIQDNLFYVNPNDSGLVVYDLDRAEEKYRIDVDGTGNGIALSKKYAFLAQGEAGVKIFNIEKVKESSPRFVGTLDYKNNPGSANQVASDGNSTQPTVFIADGRGGFQIMKFYSAIRLQAKKFYNPSVWEDGEYEVSGETRCRIPSEIPVVSGNSGNHWVELYFDDISCRYQGGADQAKPKQGSSQWEKGLSYNKFVSCSDGSQPGDFVRVANKIRLNLANGNDEAGSTIVQVDIGLE